MDVLRIVLDTNVLYAGLYSSRGASYGLLRAIEEGKVRIVLSPALLFEYEDVLRRDRQVLKLSEKDVGELLDALCRVAEHQRIHFLWRPVLSDPKDDHLLELAVAAGGVRIVTFNVRHFEGVGQFGVKVCRPKRVLENIR